MVGTYSLISLEDYKSFAKIGNTELEKDAFSIYFGGACTTATAAKSGNTLTLTKDGAPTTINLAAVAYDTLTELVAYINTLAGWVANLEGTGSAASTDLKNFATQNVKGTDNEYTLIGYDNYSLERLIDQASSELENYLRRKIKTRSFKQERYDGGERLIFLKNYPVTSVEEVCLGVNGVIRLQYVSATARNAYVKVDADAKQVVLIHDGTTDATLDLSALTTMATLAAAIEAVSGWTAEVCDSLYNAYRTADLFTSPNRFCLNEWADLETPGDPISDYEVNLGEGWIELPYAACEDVMSVFVSYTAGFASVSEYDDLALACCRLVKYHDDRRETDEGMKSESKADYSFTAVDLKDALGPETLKGLKKYQRPLV
jgi:hypothetical protein